jgi:hypothetical protein
MSQGRVSFTKPAAFSKKQEVAAPPLPKDPAPQLVLDPAVVKTLTIFRSGMPVFNTLCGNKKIMFRNHIYQTEDAECAQFLRDNFITRKHPTLLVEEISAEDFIASTQLPVVQPVIEPLLQQDQEEQAQEELPLQPLESQDSEGLIQPVEEVLPTQQASQE